MILPLGARHFNSGLFLHICININIDMHVYVNPIYIYIPKAFEQLSSLKAWATTIAKVPYNKIGLVAHPYLSVVHFATFLANSRDWSHKLLAGFCYTAVSSWKAAFSSFWESYASVDPNHSVFTKHGARLSYCCPIFLHGDEGTSYGRKGLFQYSWSPLLSAGASGLSRYFMISQLSHKFYSKQAKGNIRGNPALDAIMEAGCLSCLQAYEEGIPCGDERIFLVTLGLTGDHVFHSNPGLHQHMQHCWGLSWISGVGMLYMYTYICMCTMVYYVCLKRNDVEIIAV